MTTVEFTARDWIERLALALDDLATTQDHYYRDELDELLWQQLQRQKHVRSALFRRIVSDAPSDYLQNFYFRASEIESRLLARRYGPLRPALDAVQSILATHPAWRDVVNSADGLRGLSIRIGNFGSSEMLLGMIGGLMTCGMGKPEDGFRVAAAELHGLLDPERNLGRIPDSRDLLVGYHVVLFYGLRVSEEVQLADGMALLPFEQLGAFVNENVLQDVAPTVLRFSDQRSVGALVKSFRWKPKFQKPDDDATDDLDWEWNGSFFEDAEAFIELLALFHATPGTCRRSAGCSSCPPGSPPGRWPR